MAGQGVCEVAANKYSHMAHTNNAVYVFNFGTALICSDVISFKSSVLEMRARC